MRSMTPEAFISKWKSAELTERAAAQAHFIDLCHLLDEPTPADVDPKGEWYAFEKGATKTHGGEGWADVWKRGCFGWEYKGKRKDLNAAFAQLQQYALALENPPLLIVSDLDRFRIHTNWTNTISEVHEARLDDLRDTQFRQKLKWAFAEPDRLRPQRTRQALTEKAAAEFAALAQRLRARGHSPELVAHFVNRLVFCMFAEDVDLLPNRIFSRMLTSSVSSPAGFATRARDLFSAMRLGGEAAWERIEWFNGGLFDSDVALPMEKEDIELAVRASELDWGEIDPSILGTLFERGLDPDKRSQLGAHYTDRAKISLIIEPMVVRPLLAEWEASKEKIQAALLKEQKAKSASAKTRAHGEALSLFRGFLDRLRSFRVLDPACGSGNFLYLALLALKDLEHRVSIEGEALGFQREFPDVGPSAVLGIEINPYAAELARVSVWIGEIQWMRRNGFGVSKNPILKALETIECRDALLKPGGTEAEWPKADVIIGNPPFLGDRRMVRGLGEEYVQTLRRVFHGQLPGAADFVCYWFARARHSLESGQTERVGFVATNSVRTGASRAAIDAICISTPIFEAYGDEEWNVDGAAVRVAIVCFGHVAERRLDGLTVLNILPDLTANAVDYGLALPLRANVGVSFVGVQKNGPFDVPGTTAREWLLMPANPHGLGNKDVLRPAINGGSIAGRDPGRWLIDFGPRMSQADASLFEKPFEHVRQHVRPTRVNVRRDWHRTYWWLHGDPRPGFRKAVANLSRYVCTPMVSKHRLFVFVDARVLPENKAVAFARDDYFFFGLLSSTYHEEWTLRRCTFMGVGNDPSYSPSRCFDTFPFPEGLTPQTPSAHYASDPRAARIATAAKRLDELRQAWLNPPDLVKRVPEVVPGFPDRLLPVDEKAAGVLKKRTLTNLYNERPTWLANAHRDLDAAVAAAYGWPDNISENDFLALLLELNLQRSAAQGALLRPATLGDSGEPDEAMAAPA